MSLLRYIPLLLIIVIVISGTFYLFSDKNDIQTTISNVEEETKEDKNVEEIVEEKKVDLGFYEAKVPAGMIGTMLRENIHESVNLPPEVKAYCFDICHKKKSLGLKLEPISTEEFECSCENSFGLYGKEAELYANKADEYDKEIKAKDDFSHLEVQHWRHMPLTYAINDEKECGEFVASQIQKAVGIIEDATDNIVRFEEVGKDPDIEFFCTFLKCDSGKMCIRDSLGNAGWQFYDNRIYYAVIELVGIDGYSEKGLDSGFYASSCDTAEVEVHEILHTFLGVDKESMHNDIPNSIMYKQGRSGDGYIMTPEKCAKIIPRIIDADIIQKLKSNYRQNN